MKKEFKDHLEAIDWIANYSDDEGKFEVLREQLNMNYISHGVLFIDLTEKMGEVILLG